MSTTQPSRHTSQSVKVDTTSDSLQGYYAGFSSRAFAWLIDYAIIFLVTAVAVIALTLFFEIPSIQHFVAWLESVLPGSNRLFGWLTSAPFGPVFFLLFQYLYFVFCFSTTGQTAGKAVMGLRVVTIDGKRLGVRRSFIRALCYTLSLAPLGLGFFWVLGDDQRQAWHDTIARTYVLYVWDAHYEENFLRNAVYKLTTRREAKKSNKSAK